MSNASHTQPRPSLRLAGIVALFTLLGPLLGALGMNALLSILAALTAAVRGDYGDIASLLIGGTTVGTFISLPIAYTFGLVPALGVGLIVALGERKRIGVSWAEAFVGAVVFWLLGLVLALGVVPPAGRVVWFAGLLIAHLAGALLCAALARKIFGRR